ncbi:glucose-6-phosphate dehydrogenase assembly protein OpcA [bacterium]|nr:glucose-6-phosphate dehydrogenase assembly protein OpcA [bacterium]
MENGITSTSPGEIEKTLLSLFEQEQKTGVIKASLFNLVIFCEENERVDYLKSLCISLIKKFPCRIIFIKELQKQGDHLETRVSALKPEGENEGFFCEFIEFDVSSSYKERISYLVTPHVIPDLPIYLLFSKDIALKDTPTTLKLDKLPLRIIFDSECMEHMSEFAKYIDTIKEEHTSIGDLNWARFTPWRRMLCKVFASPENHQTLLEAKKIHITYNTHATDSFRHNKIQATYMQGWIAEKLGWEFKEVSCEEGKVHITYTSSKGEHLICLEGSAANEDLYPGRLTGIEIKSGQRAINFLRDATAYQLIKISYCKNDHCEVAMTYPITNEGTGTSMSGEIYSRETSKDFLASLKLIGKLNTGIICS